MPFLLNADASFSSKQELLDLQDCPLGGGACLDTPSPGDSQTASPLGSDPGSPGNPPTDVSMVPPRIFTGASTALDTLDTPADPPQLCGWGALTPRSAQAFNTPRWVLFFLCAASFLQGMIVNGFINTVVTSIERRFDLRSYQAGLVASSYDIAACVCLVFVSYFGGTGHKPRWLGWGVLIMALGSLVFALPHFVTPPYQVGPPQSTGMCSANRTQGCRDRAGGGGGGGGGRGRGGAVRVPFLHGMGATPLYTLGVTYLDENVSSAYGPVYIGIFYTAAIVGPAAGYLLGGYFLNIYTELHMKTEMTPENPHWKHVAMRVSEAHQLKDGSHTTASDPQFGKSAKDMPREEYSPVCGADGVMYYSPCHAGCDSTNNTQHPTGRQVYSGCSCVVGNVSWGAEGFALTGKCSSSCNHMPAFLSLLFDQCGEQGSCYLYHNSAMSQYTLVAGIIYKMIPATSVYWLMAELWYR
ncbi:unnamed protein product [Menidia menidia]|uniref:(Atlantic silverside) hypothetical protein n=1 Tax=Menidia menidia TaxID=238744 RepID=A0A8S4B7I5_9TELE|nr:unnamed protein product [Menidia menidia]